MIGGNITIQFFVDLMYFHIYFTGIDKAGAAIINLLYSSATITKGVNTVLYSLL